MATVSPQDLGPRKGHRDGTRMVAVVSKGRGSRLPYPVAAMLPYRYFRPTWEVLGMRCKYVLNPPPGTRFGELDIKQGR